VTWLHEKALKSVSGGFVYRYKRYGGRVIKSNYSYLWEPVLAVNIKEDIGGSDGN
jgi:hypothetical protein